MAKSDDFVGSEHSFSSRSHLQSTSWNSQNVSWYNFKNKLILTYSTVSFLYDDALSHDFKGNIICILNINGKFE